MGIFLAFLPLFIFLLLVSPPLAQSSKDAPPPPATYTHTLNHITPSPLFPQTGSVGTKIRSFLIHSHSQNI